MGRWKFRTETEVSKDVEKRNGEKRSGVQSYLRFVRKLDKRNVGYLIR